MRLDLGGRRMIKKKKQTQIPVAERESRPEVRGEHANETARSGDERGGLHGANVGFPQDVERVRPGKDVARRDVLNDHTLAAAHRGAADSWIVGADLGEEVEKGLS